MTQGAVDSLVGIVPVAVASFVALTFAERALRDRTLEGDPPKTRISKRKSKYVGRSRMKGQTCANCEFFLPEEDECQIVAGSIAPGGRSKFWTAEQ